MALEIKGLQRVFKFKKMCIRDRIKDMGCLKRPCFIIHEIPHIQPEYRSYESLAVKKRKA